MVWYSNLVLFYCDSSGLNTTSFLCICCAFLVKDTRGTVTCISDLSGLMTVHGNFLPRLRPPVCCFFMSFASSFMSVTSSSLSHFPSCLSLLQIFHISLHVYHFFKSSTIPFMSVTSSSLSQFPFMSVTSSSLSHFPACLSLLQIFQISLHVCHFFKSFTFPFMSITSSSLSHFPSSLSHFPACLSLLQVFYVFLHVCHFFESFTFPFMPITSSSH